MGGSVLECVGEQALSLKDGDRLLSAFNKPNDRYMAQQRLEYNTSIPE